MLLKNSKPNRKRYRYLKTPEDLSPRAQEILDVIKTKGEISRIELYEVMANVYDKNISNSLSINTALLKKLGAIQIIEE